MTEALSSPPGGPLLPTVGVRAPAARVAFVGAGPGDPGLMTVRSRDLLGRADVVVVDDPSAEDLAAACAPGTAVVVDGARGERGEPLTLAGRASLLVACARKAPPDGLVVRLMDGDPTLFHGLAEEALALRRAGIGFDVVPGVSPVTAVPAYAGVPLTCAKSPSVQVVHASSGPVNDAVTPGARSRALDSATTVVVLGQPSAIAHELAGLVAAGRAADTPVALVEQGTTTRQVCRETTLADAGTVLRAGQVRPPVVAVVGRPVGLRAALSWFETKALFGWQVLLPRTKDDLTPTVERLATHGAAAIVVPTISFEPPRTPAQMDRAVKGLVTGHYAWIGLTSASAVRAVRERVEGIGLDARCLAGVQVAAVGTDTVKALREWGIAPDLVPVGEQSTGALLAEWPDHDPELDPLASVFLPRADISTDTLAAGLADLGWHVEDVTAYRTVRAAPPAARIRESIKGGDFDAVVFTSSSTVRNLIGIAGKPHPTTVVACIGPQTARTAEEHGLRVDVRAGAPTPEALVDALAAYGATLGRQDRESGMPPRRPSERRTAARRRPR